MEFRKLSDDLSVAGQVDVAGVREVADQGFRSVIVNRPDGEGSDQPSFAQIEAAARAIGLEARYVPVQPGEMGNDEVAAFATAFAEMPKPILAYCKSGNRSAGLWAASQDVGSMVSNTTSSNRVGAGSVETTTLNHDVVVVGGGAAGLATAASLLSRCRGLDIAVIEPAVVHYYQPGWTMVGGGIFKQAATAKSMQSLMPSRVTWIKGAVAAFEPDKDVVALQDGRSVHYKRLVVCPGLKLDWDKIEGLPDTLGRNGVTSNYRYDLAPYTWDLVRNMKSGRAIFTQPPMPIKCAGAPQKAMYLSADHWYRTGRLKDIDIGFYNAGGALFGVADYVPALMKYVERYNAQLNFHNTLVAVDGPAKKAWFKSAVPDQPEQSVEVDFDMLHVCPPQSAPDFIRSSPLADAAGWVDVDQSSLRHKAYDNIYALGDVSSTPNAKTAAAARKQAPVVAVNLLADMGLGSRVATYDGYGSCPLTVERGKIVLAEFGYGGKVMPSFPSFFLDGTKPTRLAWFLKERMLPPIYWKAMLKGREWMAKPVTVSRDQAAAPVEQEA